MVWVVGLLRLGGRAFFTKRTRECVCPDQHECPGLFEWGTGILGNRIYLVVAIWQFEDDIKLWRAFPIY